MNQPIAKPGNNIIRSEHYEILAWLPLMGVAQDIAKKKSLHGPQYEHMAATAEQVEEVFICISQKPRFEHC